MNNITNKKLKINYKKIFAYLWLFSGYFLTYYNFVFLQISFIRTDYYSIYNNIGKVIPFAVSSYAIYLVFNHLLLKKIIRGKILFLAELLLLLSIVSVFILHWAVKFIYG